MTRAASLLALFALLGLLSAVPAAGRAPHPLFADAEALRLTIRGPIGAIRRNAERSTDAHDASLTLEGAAPETHPIRLSARGVSRRERAICTFPPLRVEFAREPPANSLFRGQRRLKLVTHCRPAESFEQYALLEYAAYRLANELSPVSLRVRIALIDYRDVGSDAPLATRIGFFIEDIDDAARRNGLREVDTFTVRAEQLSARDAARFAVFQYLIGNLDWSMQGGPPGEYCCHNAKLLGAARSARSGLVPIPYDFDHSGLVNAPYATPPAQVPVNSVRTRRYRGFCLHNAEARTAAAEARAARAGLLSVLDRIPQLDDRVRTRASSYLADSLARIGTADAVESNLLSTCLR